MTNLLCALMAFGQAAQEPAAPVERFGPINVAYQLQFSGDQYDPAQNDIRVAFVNSKNEMFERLAYFDGSYWRASFAAPAPGKYKIRLRRNGAPTFEPERTIELKSSDKIISKFVSIDPNNPKLLPDADFTKRNLATWERLVWVLRIRKAGGNLIRMSAADALRSDHLEPFDQKRLKAVDTLLSLCERCGVRAQIVLFEGASLTSASPKWKSNPWNAEKGGFLKDPSLFFSDAEARRRAISWVRQAAARWGSLPAVANFEICSDVEKTDAALQGKQPEIQSWTNEMSEILKLAGTN